MKKIINKIAVVTGTRAEYGLLKPIIRQIEEDKRSELLLFVTAMHLSKDYGYTVNEIQDDNFTITKKIKTLKNSDSEKGIVKLISNTQNKFTQVFDEYKPDYLLVLGDRSEIFGVCIAAYISRIPILHISGGEVTKGAYDEAFRHCITKMSSLHFTSTELHRKRVIQLGESPETVFNVGAIGLDSIKNLKLLSKKEFEKSINFKLGKLNFLLTYHPQTLEDNNEVKNIRVIFNAIEKIKDVKLIITKPNYDKFSNEIIDEIDKYAKKNYVNVVSFESLGQLRYLSALKHVDLVIGNSSSGIVETPSFKRATVNIGTRQLGRECSSNIINVKFSVEDIHKGIELGISENFRNQLKSLKSIYGNGTASTQIMSIINKKKSFPFPKLFYDLNFKI